VIFNSSRVSRISNFRYQGETDEECVGTFAGASGAGKYFARNIRGVTVTHDPVKDGVVSQARQVLCAYSFGLCPFPLPPNVTVPFPSEEPKNPKKFQSKGGEPLRWVHVSDVHIDRGYIVCILRSSSPPLHRLSVIKARRRGKLHFRYLLQRHPAVANKSERLYTWWAFWKPART
jgi:hypothetical protein